MTQSTQQEAFTAFRMLRDVNAGRLRGQSLSRYGAPIPCGTLEEHTAAVLRAELSRRPGTPLAGDALVYVISCDGTPIAWLSRDATVTTPAAQLTDYQMCQQSRAVQTLAELSRHAIRALAALRDQAIRRTGGRMAATAHPANTPVRTCWSPTRRSRP